MSPSSIEWTDETWNPTLGCSIASTGCDHCYAARVALRGLSPEHEGLTKRVDGVPRFTGMVRLLEARLEEPLHWRKPRRVFVDSMSDLFHPRVPVEFIDRVFDVMEAARQHTFQVLTKRPQRMARYSWRRYSNVTRTLPNVWLGVSIESDDYAGRAEWLRRSHAAVRFLSCEPLLGPLSGLDLAEIDWVIVGGESGPGSRPMHPAWPRELRDRCLEATIPFFFKQWGEWRPQPIYSTDDRHRVLMLDGTLRGTPWSGWKRDQPDAEVMERVGKHEAGRELDGRTWDEMPEVKA